jgi:hypothetical protein
MKSILLRKKSIRQPMQASNLSSKIRRLKLRPTHPQQRRTNRQLRLLIKTSLRVMFLPLPKPRLPTLALRLETAMQRTLVKPQNR